MQVDASNLKKKDFIKFREALYQITSVDFYHPGKGRTVMRTKLKQVGGTKTLEQVFTSSEMVDVLEVVAAPVQYLFTAGDTVTFMHTISFEQYEVSKALVGEVLEFLKEGQDMYLLLHDDVPVGIRAPKSVSLLVTDAEDAIKGDSATNAKKLVGLETGAKILVPLFIKKGEKISINPDTCEYQGRDNS